MSIKIGNKNKIKNSSIGNHYSSSCDNKEVNMKKSFVEKHPIFISFMTSLVVGFILLFSFWNSLIEWIEGQFK